MKLIVDENIPFGKETFSQFGDVTLINGREINNKICRNAEILIVRSITKVNKELLDGINIRFVGSATTGDDHIDTKYLDAQGIKYYVAKGCNAYSVVEYVFAAITHFANKFDFRFEGKTLGIVGVGKIGSKVAAIGNELGFEVIKNDPPLQRQTGSAEYRSLQDALSADIITLHVPLNITGIDKTHHLLDAESINLIRPNAILINASRGPVIDNFALLNRLKLSNDIISVLDVWENEPDINIDLLKLTRLGSAHIAGYSLEGKVNGTTMVYEELCKFLGITTTYEPDLPVIENPSINLSPEERIENVIQTIFNSVYKITEDDQLLRVLTDPDVEEEGKYFDQLRKTYRIRRELDNYNINAVNFTSEIKRKLTALRLKFSN